MGLLLILSLITQADAPKKPQEPQKKQVANLLVPILGYKPKVGDRVVIYSRQRNGSLGPYPVAADYSAYSDLVKYARAGDNKGLDDLVEAKRVVSLESGTGVLVLETSYLDENIGDENHIALWHVKVRILDGSYKDQVVFAVPTSVQACRVVRVKVKVKKR